LTRKQQHKPNKYITFTHSVIHIHTNTMTCHILLLHPSQHKQRNTLITQKSNHCVIVQLHNQHSPAAHAAWTPLMYSCKQQPSITIVGHPTHGNLACYTTSQLPLLLCYQYTAIKPLRHCTTAQPAQSSCPCCLDSTDVQL